MTRTVTIRGIPDALLERLRARAAHSRRSLNGELLMILEAVAAEAPPSPTGLVSPAPAVYEAAASYVARDPSNDALAEVDRDALAAICRRHHIRRLEVFGSLAEGRVRADSDADVVVEFEAGRTPGFGIVRIAEALRPAFGGRRVDVHTPHEVRRMRGRVMSSLRTLYAAE